MSRADTRHANRLRLAHGQPAGNGERGKPFMPSMFQRLWWLPLCREQPLPVAPCSGCKSPGNQAVSSPQLPEKPVFDCKSRFVPDRPQPAAFENDPTEGKIILEISGQAVRIDRRQSSGVRSSSFTAKNAVVSSEAACSRWFMVDFLNRQAVRVSDYLC